jgi:acyl carrier protein
MATSPRAEIVKKYKEVDAFVQYGPRWDVLKEVYFQADQGLCVLELATNFLADLEKLYLHPALLDIATNFLAYHQHTTGDVAYLPFFYKKLSIYGPLPKKCLSYARHKAQEQNQEETGEFLVYDITLMDEWGKILVDVEGFTLRKSSTDVWRSQTAASKETNKDDHDLFSITHDEMKERLRSGIQPQEGVEVFKRILSHAMLPQVIVSTRDIHTVLELAEPIPLLVDLEATEQAIANTSYQRPDLQTAYVAPGNEIEQQVAAIWQNMLGIEKVGIRDNFFEVGGDSLTGTRMINQLRKVLAVDLSIRQLFTKPTIEGIAETIMQQRQETSKL